MPCSQLQPDNGLHPLASFICASLHERSRSGPGLKRLHTASSRRLALRRSSAASSFPFFSNCSLCTTSCRICGASYVRTASHIPQHHPESVIRIQCTTYLHASAERREFSPSEYPKSRMNAHWLSLIFRKYLELPSLYFPTAYAAFDGWKRY